MEVRFGRRSWGGALGTLLLQNKYPYVQKIGLNTLPIVENIQKDL